jgi:pyridoxine 5-phosphate synthase
MVRLSVNINKFATLRNARGGNNPDIIQVALDCERFGAQGITVHPRPDERHIRFADVRSLTDVVSTEFNIEGYPSQSFIDLVLETSPTQVTLVPDPPDVLTSNAGWDTIKHKDFLTDVISTFRSEGIRTSLFLDPNEAYVEAAAQTGTDRVELYTESYAAQYSTDQEKALHPFVTTARAINNAGMQLNAGHDLDLNNLAYFTKNIPGLKEVSIGHALVCDALYLGLENAIQLYLKACGRYSQS